MFKNKNLCRKQKNVCFIKKKVFFAFIFYEKTKNRLFIALVQSCILIFFINVLIKADIILVYHYARSEVSLVCFMRFSKTLTSR